MTDKAGTYLCVAQALVFKGSVLAYNPARDEAEWVPTRGIANDLSWVEKLAVALANYVPRISQEGTRIVRLGAYRLMNWPNDSSSMEEEEEREEEEEHEEGEEWKEAGPEPLSSDAELKQGEAEEEPEPGGQ